MFSVLLSLFFFFFFNDTATTEIYTLSLHDALPIWCSDWYESGAPSRWKRGDTRSEEHTSELQSRGLISYAVFCLKKKKQHTKSTHISHRSAPHHTHTPLAPA